MSNNKNNIGAILVCAGKGERTGLSFNKILYPVGHSTLLDMTLEKFEASVVTHIVIVAAECDVNAVKRIASGYAAACAVTVGGNTRTQSVRNGLNCLYSSFKDTEFECIVVHDGARPFVTPELINRCVADAARFGSGIAAVKTTDTIRRVSEITSEALPRNELYNIQTPQAFNAKAFTAAYDSVIGDYTDDARVFELNGGNIHLTEGAYDNIKITTPADLFKLNVGSRIGTGYDVHRLIPGRPLILGGVRLEYEKGLLGHSDADVLIHAIMDALLSAAELPDIGVLFPDTDDKYKDVSSVKLLEDVLIKISERGYKIGNVSAVIMAQRPKLADYITDIRKNLANVMEIDLSMINVSATTTEGLGIIGSGDAIASNAACILTEKPIL